MFLSLLPLRSSLSRNEISPSLLHQEDLSPNGWILTYPSASPTANIAATSSLQETFVPTQHHSCPFLAPFLPGTSMMVEDSVTRPVPHAAIITTNSLAMVALIRYLEL